MPFSSLRRLGLAVPLCALLGLSPALRAEANEPENAAADPAVAYSIDALAPTLPTPEAAFAFVRDRIAYEPYAGAMKGAAGTLLTRGGNSWDRALLLQKLLSAQGVEVRLVVATLSEKEAGRRFVTVSKQPSATKQVLAALPAVKPKEADDPARQRVGAKLQQRMSRRAAELKALEAVPSEWIEPALAGLAPEPVEAPRELVWVRAMIAGQVVALDPSLPTAKFGDEPKVDGEAIEHAEPPEEVRHRLTVKLALENLSAEGGLQQRDLLGRTFTTVSLLETGLRLAVLPRTAGKTAGNFRALLLAGEEKSESESFRLTGAPSPEGGPKAEAVSLGGMFGGEEEPVPAPPAAASDLRLARLFVEFTLVSPGLPDETLRRTIIDRVEPAGSGWRMLPALADDRSVRPVLAQIWDAALDCGTPHPAAVWEASWAAVRTLDPLLLSAKARLKFEPRDIAVPTVSPVLQGFSLASGLRRQALCAAAGAPVRCFAMRPRLALMRHGAEIADWTNPGAAGSRYREGIDLVNTPYRFFGAARAVELARQAGVADTALEVHAVARAAGLNTIPVFAAATVQKLKFVAIPDAATLRERALPPAVQAALLRELQAGQRIIMPERPVAYAGSHVFAWWSVDPASGYALGRMELGGGQALTEQAKLDEQIADWTEMISKFYGSILKCYMGALRDALGSVNVDYENMKVDATLNHGGVGESPMPDADQLVDCVIDAACEAIQDLMDSQINAAVAGFEIEKYYEFIMARLADQKNADGSPRFVTPSDALNKACKSALGGGGGE